MFPMNTMALILAAYFAAMLAYIDAQPSVAGLGLTPEQPTYLGNGVGPLWMFRSSSENAAKVNDALKNRPIARSLALAFGDEFPRIRDDIVRRLKEVEANSVDSVEDQGLLNYRTLSRLRVSPYVVPAISPTNWRFNRANTKKEVEDPYYQPGILPTLLSVTRAGGAGTSGLFGTVLDMASSFLEGGIGAVSGAGPIRGRLRPEFHITADSPSRSFVTPSKTRTNFRDDFSEQELNELFGLRRDNSNRQDERQRRT